MKKRVVETELREEEKPIKHDIGITVWLDYDSYKELGKIALFEHEKRGPLCRRIIVEKVQVYGRNPAYKRFLKTLEQEGNPHGH